MSLRLTYYTINNLFVSLMHLPATDLLRIPSGASDITVNQ